jgi:glycine cleavage system aminomethyltransferase T
MFYFCIQFYAYWGYDLDSQSTPYECGRAFRVRLENKNNINYKTDFIGRDAFLKQKKVFVKNSKKIQYLTYRKLITYTTTQIKT